MTNTRTESTQQKADEVSAWSLIKPYWVSEERGFAWGLLVAIIAFVAGGTTAARQLRASSSQAAQWVRSAGDRRGISTGPVGIWLDEQRTLVRVVVIALAALALVLADMLTPAYVITVFVVALLVLGLATLAARPRPRTEETAEEVEPAPVG